MDPPKGIKFQRPTFNRKTFSPIGFLFLKLPPPPCAVLLVDCSILPRLPCQSSVDCGMWRGVEGKVWSVKKVVCSVGDILCRVSVECEVGIVEGGVQSVKCGVESVKCRVWSVKCGV